MAGVENVEVVSMLLSIPQVVAGMTSIVVVSAVVDVDWFVLGCCAAVDHSTGSGLDAG